MWSYGNVDLALIALYAFWLFFILLIIYLQRENMREGYPLVSEVTGNQIDAGPFPLPRPKTFKLPHGGGEKIVPDGQMDAREIAAIPADQSIGSGLVPTGNPLVDGVGPAAWAERADQPDIAHDGRPKIAPLRAAPEFAVIGRRKDPRGFPVVAGDGATVGTISDIWIDRPESLARYVEIDLGEAGRRLCPMSLVKLRDRRAHIHAIFAEHFADVPMTAAPDVVTLLEEDRISAYYCGGKLYASESRQEPWM